MKQSVALKTIQKYIPTVRRITKREQWATKQSDAEMRSYTDMLRAESTKGIPDHLLIDACALAREAARRVLHERMYDVQLIGALALHDGIVVEMKTGEGKTISSVPTLYINAVSGDGVHVVTVNDYLAKRDALWMREVFRSLNVNSAYIDSETDFEQRKAAYQADITYGTNNEFGFDYLRDNLCRSIDRKVQRGHNFCIIDEADSILIDEARTPLIISGAAEDNTRHYRAANKLARLLIECVQNEQGEYDDDAAGDYKLNEKNKHVSFTTEGMEHIEKMLLQNKLISGSLYSGGNFEFIHYFTQALRAQKLYAADTDYVIKDGQVQIVDEYTGRVLRGRRYSEGLHQAIEAKENMPIAQRSRTVATITLQNYFRQYKKISGMTGTAATEERELGKIYGLRVAVIPTNKPIIRVDHNDIIYSSEEKKHSAIATDVAALYAKGQPVLLGTTTIEKSEVLSRLFAARNLPHTVLNAKNHSEEARIVSQAGSGGGITIATNMAGRGTDIKLGGDPHFTSNIELESDSTHKEQMTEEMAEQNYAARLQEVRAAGGLCVIGTERHDSRRIDNQLRGRSGRQGDPGVSKFYISLDDQLMRLFGERRKFLKSVMERGLGAEQALDHPLINRSIEKAQQRVEERNFEIRKHLLEFDDVINEQRTIVYAQRDEILVAQSLNDRLLTTVSMIAERECADYKRQQDPEQRGHAVRKVRDTLLMDKQWRIDEGMPTGYEAVMGYIQQYAQQDLEKKEQAFGAEQWNFGIRQEYLRQIDAGWQDHLESLDALREAVYLRSYAQKNPLLEYKIEGFQMFDQMIEDIRTAVAKRFFALSMERVAEITMRGNERPAPAIASRHRSFQQFETIGQGTKAAQANAAQLNAARGAGAANAARGGMAQANAGRGGMAQANAGRPGATRSAARPVVRDTQKVGRNDPCPCGSGKKYKYCHGK